MSVEAAAPAEGLPLLSDLPRVSLPHLQSGDENGTCFGTCFAGSFRECVGESHAWSPENGASQSMHTHQLSCSPAR